MKKFHSGKDESTRMFKSSFSEFFTHTHWSVPLFLYVPLITFLLWCSLVVFATPLSHVFALIIGGVLTWTLTEYLLHRFVFHYEPKSEKGKRLHFIIHGVHHDYPNDSLRLVLPPIISIPSALVFYTLFFVVFGKVYVLPFFAGFGLGYLIYDMIHYAIHHAPMRGKFALFFKTQHMKHHFKEPNALFGVSSPLWDYVFRTKVKEEKEKQTP